MRERTSERPVSPRNTRALDWMNAFLADVRDGLGPYLAIYLVAVRGPTHGWDEATAGMVMTIAGIAGLLATTPAGALVDKSRAKRALLVAAALIVTLASLSLPIVSGFTAVAVTQSLAAVAGTMYLLYYGVIDFYIGFLAGVKAFTAAVLGGIGSLPGAMLGGLAIGLIETFWSGYFSVEYKDVAAFSILAIVLIFMPSGLLGRPAVEKV